jgi:hypothetical protein
VPEAENWRDQKSVRCADAILDLGILQIMFESAEMLTKKTWDILPISQNSIYPPHITGLSEFKATQYCLL